MSQRSRRSYLKGVGTVGVVALAGCMSDEGDSDTTTATQQGQGGKTGTPTRNRSYTVKIASTSSPWQEKYLVYNLDGRHTGGNGWKGNLEEESGGDFDVKLFRGGKLGSGKKLATKIQQGDVQLGKLSLANMSPYAPIADLVNLPFFLGQYASAWDLTQAWLNLTTSPTWEEKVDSKIQENGFRPIYWTGGPARSVFATEKLGAVKEPSDMEGVTHRTPGSKILAQMWDTIGANPTNIAWSETPQALKEGVASTMHVGLPGFLFGFQDVITDISMTNIVQDDITFAFSQKWYDDLPSDLQKAVDRAAEKTKREFIQYIPTADQEMRAYLENNGATVHELNEDQIAMWAEKVTWEKSMWDDYKKDFAGSKEQAKQLQEGVNHESKYQIPDF